MNIGYTVYTEIFTRRKKNAAKLFRNQETYVASDYFWPMEQTYRRCFNCLPWPCANLQGYGRIDRGRWNASGVISAGHSGGSGGNDRQPSSMHLTRLAPVTPFPSLINKDEKKKKKKNSTPLPACTPPLGSIRMRRMVGQLIYSVSYTWAANGLQATSDFTSKCEGGIQ